MGKDWTDCYARNGKSRQCWLMLAILLVAGTTGCPARAEDTREAFNPTSPLWLMAVGRLQVPGSRYENGRRSQHLEDCSATLVAKAGARKANTIITAWHCLEFYQDVSKSISFKLLEPSGQALTREAYRLADGGGMHNDWAILRLYQPIQRSQIEGITLHPARADPQQPITMAGYSRDAGTGQGGEQLSYDANCSIIAQTTQSTDSNCLAHKGASGGAVVQLSTRGQALYAGVISRGDSEGLSIYVPVSRFRSALTLHLN
jgi:hypothetical protein